MQDPKETVETLLTYFQKSMKSTNPWLLGVCSGIANRFNFDPSIVRVIAIICTVVSFKISAIVYVILWLFFFRNNEEA